MGLTIHYGLKFKGTAQEARGKLSLLREHALDTSFVEVSEIKHFIGKHECNYNNSDEEWRWASIQARGDNSVRIHPDGHRLKQGERSGVGCTWISPQPIEAIIFRTWAGEGCEESNFGLCRYENSVELHGRIYKLRNIGWSWHSFCKTQYASEKGVLNFIRCHTLVISMLDYAKKVGILKDVSDEGNYWKKRNLKDLAEEVGEWNTFIAGMSGRLSNMFGSDKLQSEIANHPNYEALKEAGMQHLYKKEEANGKL